MQDITYLYVQQALFLPFLWVLQISNTKLICRCTLSKCETYSIASMIKIYITNNVKKSNIDCLAISILFEIKPILDIFFLQSSLFLGDYNVASTL